jgi:hypothetical protein
MPENKRPTSPNDLEDQPEQDTEESLMMKLYDLYEGVDPQSPEAPAMVHALAYFKTLYLDLETARDEGRLFFANSLAEGPDHQDKAQQDKHEPSRYFTEITDIIVKQRESPAYAPLSIETFKIASRLYRFYNYQNNSDPFIDPIMRTTEALASVNEKIFSSVVSY